MTQLPVVVRHVLGCVLAWVLFPVEAAVLYLVGLVLATPAEMEGVDLMGGAALVIGTAYLGAVVTLLVFVPALVLGHLLSRRRRWIPASIASVVVAVVLGVLLAGMTVDPSHDAIVPVFGLLTLLPLGAATLTAHGSASFFPASRRHRLSS